MKSIHAPLFIMSSFALLIACSPGQLNTDKQATAQPDTTRSKETQVSKPVTAPREAKVKQEELRPAITESYAPQSDQAVGVMPAPAMLAKREYSEAEIRIAAEPLDRENYSHFDDNPVKRVSENPVSTFSIDVDTGSYSNVRRILNQGQLPRKDAVRIEELVNYFNYDYPAPASKQTPFRVTTEMGPAPWNAERTLLHIGIKGYDVDRQNVPASNLVFLIDVSGSMNSPDKLPLLKSAMKMLTRHLDKKDRVSIVVYAGASGVVLEPTTGDQKASIMSALDRLSAGGSTNGASGIRLAYAMAEQGFIKNGINRIILATDGDFNVGTTNFEALKNLVEEKRRSGVGLTTLGFGTGNYNDHLMEQLADAGNGHYAYIDTLNEARKVLVEEMSSTLQTIASDVKIQIEFNPQVVAEYRLLGYENRMLKREDFKNDKIDAGDIGAGHTVTAIYELVLKGSKASYIEPLRYQKKTSAKASNTNELAHLRLRYKQPDASSSQLIEIPLLQSSIKTELSATSDRYRFAAAVAAFGQKLRGGTYLDHYDYPHILQSAQQAKGADHFGYRGEFIQLVSLASSLDGITAKQQAKHE